MTCFWCEEVKFLYPFKEDVLEDVGFFPNCLIMVLAGGHGMQLREQMDN